MKTPEQWMQIAKDGCIITDPNSLRGFANLLVPAIQADALGVLLPINDEQVRLLRELATPITHD
jgi:hypothetical protein